MAAKDIAPAAASAFRIAYDIELSARWITDHHYSRVALQFPDQLLKDASAVVSALRKELVARGSGAESLFILGDTSFGACCVDEVAAAHGSADSVIHYGHSCLSPTVSLPVLHVFGSRPGIDASACGRALMGLLEEAAPHPIVLLFDGDVCSSVPSILQTVADALSTQSIDCTPQVPGGKPWATLFPSPSPRLLLPLVNRAHTPSRAAAAAPDAPSIMPADDVTPHAPTILRVCGYEYQLPDSSSTAADAESAPSPASCVVVYLGDQPARTRMLTARFAGQRILQMNAVGQVTDLSSSSSKLMARRFRCVEQVKAASTFGLIAGTLAVSKHNAILTLLRKVIAAAGKSSYTFLVGKLSPTKLGNFPEVDAFVLVACPESTLIDEATGPGGSGAFYKPIVTPHEVLMGLLPFCDDEELGIPSDAGQGWISEDVRSWSGKSVLDFDSLLPTGATDVMFTLSAAAQGGSGSRRRRFAGGDGSGDGDGDDLDSDEDDAPHFSLLTGGLVGRPSKVGGAHTAAQAQDADSDKAAETALVRTDTHGSALIAHSSAAAAYLTTRKWQGLSFEVDAEQVRSTAIVEGLAGIAAGYTREKAPTDGTQ